MSTGDSLPYYPLVVDRIIAAGTTSPTAAVRDALVLAAVADNRRATPESIGRQLAMSTPVVKASLKRLTAARFITADGVDWDPTPTEPAPGLVPIDTGAVDALCVRLADAVERQRGTRPTITAVWSKDMDRLMRLGPGGVAGRSLTADEVATMIDAVFSRLAVPSPTGFCWADQVRSPAALRRHWDQCRLVLKRAAGGGGQLTADEINEAALLFRRAGEG